MKRLITKSLLASIASAICVLAGNTSAATVNEYFVDHGDIGIAYEDNELELHYHFEDGFNGVGPEVEFEPNEVYIRVSDAAKLTTTNDLGFLGTTAGDEIWILPQGNTGSSGAGSLGVPFVGLATEELDSTDFISVDLSMTNFNGPGEFALWQFGTFGPNVFFQSVDGISSADNLNLGIGIHDHANFGFTEEGIYEIELTATGNLTGGGTVVDVGTFTFAVGNVAAVPEPGSVAALVSLTLVGACVRRRRKS
ncbi:choice-of-anchor M domain-containing protein [Roseiconus lacunae]|uniref:choice-of-anchor M domain-containing protein n=1 Tax=Roseiconus lacunae TaxID=2605694 RepID=UPI0030863BD4|nr:choice-of-anchor M domain-containing protein [Stieleria sp. HD01]